MPHEYVCELGGCEVKREAGKVITINQHRKTHRFCSWAHATLFCAGQTAREANGPTVR